MRYSREQNMGDHVTVLELQFARLASFETEFDDSTKLTILMSTLKDHSEFEPFITSVAVTKNANQAWRQVSSLLKEKEKWLEDKTASMGHQNTDDTERLPHMTKKVQQNRSTPNQQAVKGFY